MEKSAGGTEEREPEWPRADANLTREHEWHIADGYIERAGDRKGEKVE